MSATTRGYYSIIQYCPDPSRLEAVNIGVALFCPELHFLQARFGRRKTPVRHVFGQQDWDFINAQRAALEARLSRGDEEFQNLEGFEAFIARRAGAFRLTPPRPVKVEDPAGELDSLLIRLVGPREESGQRAAVRISSELADRFREAGVANRLQAKITVHPPGLPRPFKAPFAFRNGRLNLIEPVQFEGQTSSAVFNRASIHAVEGQFLTDYTDPKLGQLGLIVVGKFSPSQHEERKAASAVFERHGIPMHTFASLQPLIDEIRSRAHE